MELMETIIIADNLVLFVGLAGLVEFLVNATKKYHKNNKYKSEITTLSSILVGIIFALIFNFTIFRTDVHIFGVLLTGVFLAVGSKAVHMFENK